MPRKSIQTCEYWWPNSGAKFDVRLAVEVPQLVVVVDVHALPGVGVDRMRRRAERQHVEQHRLVVAVPVAGRVARPRASSPCDPQRRARLRPRPVDASIERIGQRADLAPPRLCRRSKYDLRRTARRPAAARCRSWRARRSRTRVAGRPCRGSGRRSPCSRSAPRARGPAARAEEAQRRQRALRRLLARDPAAFHADG